MPGVITVDRLIIRLKRIQQALVRVQAEVVSWDGRQGLGTVKVASDEAKALKKRFEEVQDEFDLLATSDEAIEHEPTFTTIVTALTNVLVGIEEVNETRLQAKDKDHTFKLDKIKLPSFSGEFSEWQEFHDLFLSAVHNNTTLTGAAKMVHLKSALTGEAKTIVSNCPSTTDSYLEAWKSVTDRYSNKREIVFAHLRKLWRLKTQPDTSTGLRKLCDTFNECTRSLKLLKIEVDKWDVMLVFIALEKLEDESKQQWLLTQKDELPKLSDLLEFMEKRATALVDTSKSASKKSNSSSTSSHHASQGQPKGLCPYCGEGHPLFKCKEYHLLSTDGKSKYVHKAQLCVNCLSPHKTKECTSKVACKKCGKQHHTSLHFERNPRTSATSSTASGSSHSSSSGQHVPSTPPENRQEEIPSFSSSFASGSLNHSVILLATLLVDILDDSGQKQVCRVFLDTGTEENFISEAAVDRLGLRRQKYCALVTGIGGASGGNAQGIVSFKAFSRVNNYQLPVVALIMPKLTGHLLPRIKCQPKFGHIKGLQLADPDFYKPSHVDIMLSTVAAAQLLLPGIRRGLPGTPLAQNTRFGWVLLGSAPKDPQSSPPVSSHTVQVFHSECSSNDTCLEASLRRFWEWKNPNHFLIILLLTTNSWKNISKPHTNGIWTAASLYNCPFPLLARNWDNPEPRLSGASNLWKRDS